jgi:hypothetical protein
VRDGAVVWIAVHLPAYAELLHLRTVEFDLERRLTRYPCSCTIYTEAFDALPPITKDAIYRRMWRILSGKATGGRYGRLSLASRKAVVEILRDTKPGLPDYFGDVIR